MGVNEAYDEISRRGGLGAIPIEEEIVAVNEGKSLTIQTLGSVMFLKKTFLSYFGKTTD